MKAIEWVKKLGGKPLGKKLNMAPAGNYSDGLTILTLIAPDGKKVPLVLGGGGDIQLPEHWKN